ncbi:hypothetical protein [Pedobacter suwonensis]|uniref:hypothetical protein n=1 Tax=Pedobacter suwonensis TaxID=332999 RepID=UPI00368D77C7
MKKNLRLKEKIFLIAYAAIWLLVYLLSRFFLEIYTDDFPSSMWKWLFVFIVPISLYATVRTFFSKEYKWYSAIGHFVMYTLLGLFTGNYIIVNGDILISSAIKTPSLKRAEVIEVRKVFYKSSFNYTSVTLQIAGKVDTFQGRPFVYFYLKNRKALSIRCGRSFLRNEYAYTVGIENGEKLGARWMHFKDQIYRVRILLGIILLVIVAGFIASTKLQNNTKTETVKIGFWKLMSIVIGILLALSLLFYVGLFVYVKFFSGKHF